MLSQWLLIMVCNSEPMGITHHDSQPLAQYSIPWFTTTGSALHTMIHNHWISITHHASQTLVNHGVLCWVSGCELWCAMLVNHGELYWASGCESWFAMLCQWLWVMVSYSVPGVWIMVCNAEPWFTATGSALHSMIYNHWLSITHHNSQPLAQHCNTWLTTTCSALHTMIHIHFLSITHHHS
jgi:hypothetical protein